MYATALWTLEIANRRHGSRSCEVTRLPLGFVEVLYGIRYSGSMARKLVQYIEITDDFDRESPADETVEIAVDGMVYELDLTDPKAKEIREFLNPFMKVAHDKWKMPPRPGKKRKTVVAQALTETPQAASTSRRSESYV